jgi:ATP-dependent metalloprotease FtsH
MLYRKARKLARKYGACILFIDEIDAIGQARGGRYAGQGFMGPLFGWGGSAMLNELLLQLDPPPQEVTLIGRLLRLLGLRRGRAELPPVLTIAATNLPDTLDPALLRPGRFDRKIVVDLPSAEGRREIIEYYLSKVKHDPNIPIDFMVHDTIGYTPAAIRYVINEAVIHAHFEGRNYITYEDFTAARETHELGLRQPIRTMSFEERRRIAYHEAGHAVVAYFTPGADPLRKISIVPRGRALGVTVQAPEEDRFNYTRNQLLGRLAVLLGGRAAEQLVFHEVTTGAQNDLKEATQLARRMVGLWGMSEELGPIYLGLGEQHVFLGREIVQDHSIGTSTLDRADQAVQRLLNEAMERAERILREHREELDRLADLLIAEETVGPEKIREVLGEQPVAAGDD